MKSSKEEKAAVGIMAGMATSLQQGRNSAGEFIASKFMDYVNADLWEDRDQHEVTPVKNSDASSVKAAKHGMLLMKDAEEITQMLSQGYGSIAIHVVTIAAKIKSMKEHASELSTLIKGMSLPGAKEGESIKMFEAISKLQSDVSQPHLLFTELQTIFSGNFPSLSSAVEGVVNDYMTTSTVPIPQEPEQKRSLSEKELKQLPEWKPTAQEKMQPFMFVGQALKAVNMVERMTHYLNSYIDEMEAKGENVDREEVAMVKRTLRALENARFDDAGYFILEGQPFVDRTGFTLYENETPLSQSMKGIFNIMYGVNELVRGYQNTPGIRGHLSAAQNGIRALGGLNSTVIPELGPQVGMIYNQFQQSMMFYAQEQITPKLSRVADWLLQVELENELKPGTLSNSVKRGLDGIELSYIQAGFATRNPFAYSDDTLKTVTSQLKSEGNTQYLEATIVELADLATKYTDENLTEDETALLLRGLSSLHAYNVFNDNEMKTVAAYEDRLIHNLSQERKNKLMTELRGAEGTKILDPGLLQKLVLDSNKSRLSYAREKSSLMVHHQDISQMADLLNKVKGQQHQLGVHERKNDEVRKRIQAGMKEHTSILLLLATEGLDPLLRVAEMSAENSKLNLKQKRLLAAVVAEVNGSDRQKSLDEREAHKIAMDLVKNPESVQKLVKQIAEFSSLKDEAKTIAQSLAVGTMLAGYAEFKFDDPLLQSGSAEKSRQYLIDALSRLEVSQLISLFDQSNKSVKRITLFKALLDEKPVDEQTLTALSNTVNKAYTQEDFLTDLKNTYIRLEEGLKAKNIDSQKELDTPERTQMNKIGLLIGRLSRPTVRLNEQMHASMAADFVFKDADLTRILKHETIDTPRSATVHADPALYYESLVSTLGFNYPDGKSENENREFRQFAQDNAAVLKKMATVLNLDEQEQAHMKNDPEFLLEKSELFTRKFTTANSPAQLYMKQFMSAVLLAEGPEAVKVRELMLDSFLQEKGSLGAKHLGLMTPEASFKIWEKMRNELGHRSPTEMLGKLEQEQDRLLKSVDANITDDAVAEKMKNDIQSDFTQRSKNLSQQLDKVLAEVLHASKDIPLRIKVGKQNIDLALLEAKDQFSAEWSKKLGIKHEREVLKQGYGLDLGESLDKYIKELNGIVNGRGKGMFGLFDTAVHKNQLQLAKESMNVLKNIQKDFNNGVDPNECAMRYAEVAIMMSNQNNSLVGKPVKNAANDTRIETPKDELTQSIARMREDVQRFENLREVRSTVKLPKAS